VLWGLLRRRRGDMHVHQQRFQLSRQKLVFQGRLCLRASKLVLWGLLRRRRGDMHVHQRLYQLSRHKIVLQGRFSV